MTISRSVVHRPLPWVLSPLTEEPRMRVAPIHSGWPCSVGLLDGATRTSNGRRNTAGVTAAERA
jgi:hypothetical protein